MDIPYVITARPDTGLWNAKIAIWLFLASEVMLFGGLFSAYVFLRMGADPGHWPHGLLNVPVGMLNTTILIASSITAVFAWASLKLRQFARYKFFMGLTILCGITFLAVKLGYEYPQKFGHFGAFIKSESLAKYEPYLGNSYLAAKKLPPRVEIMGHLHNREALTNPDVKEYEVALDAANADPTNPEFDRPHFIQKPVTDKVITIDRQDVEFASVFAPRHSSFFAIYFTITGLHALHVIGGLLVFIYFWLPIGSNLYLKDPEHLANRVEVSCLYWHFVDLVWIFAFPVFYLL